MKTLADVIRCQIIEQGGILPFFRFMELALYCPKLGYYEAKTDSIGRHGDFFTSVSVGSLFGELLAFQFARWLDELKQANLKLVEAGAHDGQLAKDILTWLQSHRPDLFTQVEYCVIEPSARRRKTQQETLKNFTPKFRWFSDLNSSTFQPLAGIILSNELLDAFPVRRLGWNAPNQKWFEWGVAASGRKFVWTKIEKREGRLPSFLSHFTASLRNVLPDNFTVEIHPAAENWWRQAARSLNAGKLITADYGLTDDEIFLPSRKNGTLRAFFRHHFADDILANPGQQDLTAHVNFSRLQEIGEAAGLKTDFFSTQAKFLTRILEDTLKEKKFAEWTSTRARQFQTLTHPEHLGCAFRVLVQSR